MKKIMTVLAASVMMFAGANAFAQVSVGGGYVNLEHTYKASKDSKASSSQMNGAYVGVDMNIPIVSFLSFEPSLQYQATFSKSEREFLGVKYDGTYSEHYINLPLNLRFNLPLADDLKLFAYAGPTLSYGLVSTFKGKLSAGEASTTSTTNLYKSGDYNRFNAQVGVGAGIEALESLKIKVGYDFGVFDRMKGDAIQRTSRVHIGLAYIF